MADSAIDFCVGWGPWPHEPFLQVIREHCAYRKMSCVVCDDHNVGQVARGAETGRRPIAAYLDMQADYEQDGDPYCRLGYAARDGGAFVVNEPDRAKPAANKAVIHYLFEKFSIPVPYTIVVRNWEPADFNLTARERRRLGSPFIVKPARGFGKQGVARVRQGTVKEIAKARRFDRGDDFLIQEMVVPEWFGHRMGWFRGFYVVGQVILCWWDTTTEHYAAVTPAEFEEHQLQPLSAVVRQIGEATHMNFFSTELAVTGRGQRRKVLSIDYVNDPCDMTLQSISHCGVPDRVVHHVAERLVESAWQVQRGGDPLADRSVWFAEQ